MSMDGGDLKINVRLDTSQIADDLQTIDREVQRLQNRMVSAYNRGRLVRAGRAPRAESIEDVGGNRSAWSPEVQRLDQRLGQRLQEIERAARRGATAPPPTAAQAQRQASQARLDQLTRQTRPLQIDAPTSFFDKMRRTFSQARPDLMGMNMARGTIGGVGSGVMRALHTLALEDPALLSALGVGGAGVGVAVAANQTQTAFQRQQAALASALVGGPVLGNQRTMYGLALSGLSQSFSVDPTAVGSMAQTMAMGGIKQRDLLNNVRNAVMLAGPNQLPYGDVAGLTTALGTGGGLSNQGINQTFQDLQNVAHDSGVSVAQLVASMKALSTTAIGSARDVGGLAAVQATIGATSGVNAGQFLSPVLSATGATALQQAALLGMTPTQLLSAQSGRGGTARLYDRIAGLVRRVARGPAGVDVAEQLLTSTGLVNGQNLSPQQFNSIIQGMLSGTPRQAEQRAAQLYRQAATQRVSPDRSYQQTAQSMENLATWTDRAAYAFQNLWTNALFGGAAPASGQRRAAALIGTSNPLLTGSQGTAADRGVAFMEGSNLPGAAGVTIPSIHGGRVPITRQQLGYFRAASARSGVPLGILLAQAAAETGTSRGLNPNAPGGGLGQFTPATIHNLATNPQVPASTRAFFQHFNPANAAQSATGMGLYDQYLMQRYGSWQNALNAYNSGNPTTGYGQQVMNVDHNLTITVQVVDAQGRPWQPPIVNHTRVVTGHKSHVPVVHGRPGGH